MNRTDIIQLLINKINAKSYLEIGVYDGENFNKIRCNKKVAVDPEPSSAATIFSTSDDFFKSNNDKFDVIFIDGLHHSDQVTKDIHNSLNILNDNGYIVCHDMNPEKEEHQVIPYTSGTWNGDCWKSFVKLRQERNDLEMFVINTDYGCGVITRGKQTPITITEELNFENFSKNKNKWLNMIEVSEFKIKMNNEIENLLHQYISDPQNSEYNFALGLYYHRIGQTASAVSYYLRAAERAEKSILAYECLLRASICFDTQGTRGFTVKGLLQHAISLFPKRPEGYYMLSKYHEKENHPGAWKECYMIASIGNEVADLNPQPLRTYVGYTPHYGLLFQKAVSSWWCGLCEESRELFKKLITEYSLDETHRNSVLSNLKFLKVIS